MKKLLLLFAVLANALSASAYDFEVNGIAYNKLSGNTCEVTMKDNNFDYSDDIIIPSSVMHAGVNYTVTAIGTSAFANSGITSISIPTTVTKIGSNAFGRTNITYSSFGS